MEFKPISSSSHGNCYVVSSLGVPSLLIEAGIPIKKIREALGFGVSALAGALISHAHLDHAKAVPNLLQSGVDVYCSKETAEARGVHGHHRINILMPEVQHSIGPWSVKPFLTIHDCEGSMGFLIAIDEERLLFLTDSMYSPVQFSGLTMVAVECNFDESVLSGNIQSGAIPQVVGHRVRRSHFGLQTTKNFLLANDLTGVSAVYLLHMSSGNSNEANMVKQIQQVVGVPVYACGE